MEKMIDLKDLLIHEVQDLYSAEEQIIEAMPAMIEKAKNPTLVKALKEHLKVTENQKARLEQVQKLLGREDNEGNNGSNGNKKKGFFSSLFGDTDSGQTCLGMQGLIEEGEKVMAEDMSPKVLDAAIIASAQKIEHYEICGYGTARAYARELNLGQVAELLEETLDEEYEADDLLTDLAVGRINEEAEGGKNGSGNSKSSLRRRSTSNGRSSSNSSSGSKNKSNGSSKTASRNGSSTGAKKTAAKTSSNGKSSSSKTSSSRSNVKASSGSKSGSSKTAKKSAPKKAGQLRRR